MKDLYKNPILYYVLLPVLAALWPLLIWGVYLPHAQKDIQQQPKQYNKARKTIKKILTLDPDRLKIKGKGKQAAEFDYASVVNRTARQFKIRPANCTVNSKPIRIANKQKSRSALVILKEIDIKRLAQFLSTIQLHWANLQCEQLTLTKLKDKPDSWKAALNFKYYY